MNLIFGNAMWWLLGLVAVPVLVHLVARRRPQKKLFPSLYFLERVLRKTSRYRKPQDWLLLVLRTLAVLALAAAFLHPLLTSRQPEVGNGEKAVVIVMDVSASMAASGPDGRRYDVAREQAVRLLRDLNPKKANIIWLQAAPEASFPEPAPNIEFLVQQLNERGPRDEPGAIRAALRMAVDQLAAIPGDNKEIYVLSDFQKSAWSETELPGGVSVTTVRCAETNPPNLAVTELHFSPTDPVMGDELEVSVRVKNFSDEPRSVPLVLEIGGLRKAWELSLEPGGEQHVNLKTELKRAGPLLAIAELGEDGFHGDNLRYSVVQVRPARKMLVLGDSLPEALRGLDRALPWLVVERLPISEFADQSADYLMVLDWKGEQVEALQNARKRGIPIILAPSAHCDVSAITQLSGLPTSSVKLSQEKSSASGGWKVECVNLHHAVFHLWQNGTYGDPLKVAVYERVRLPEVWAKEGDLLLQFPDKSPALLALRGRDGAAPCCLWSVPFADNQSNLAAQESFVPFFAEFLKVYRGSVPAVRYESLPGFPLSWQPEEQENDVAGVSLRKHGEDADIALAGRLSGGAEGSFRSASAVGPGSYTWCVSGQPTQPVVVNFPVAESDLSPMPKAEMASGAVLAAAEVDRFTALREGRPLWPWLLLAAALLFLVESIVAGMRSNPSAVSSPNLPQIP